MNRKFHISPSFRLQNLVLTLVFIFLVSSLQAMDYSMDDVAKAHKTRVAKIKPFTMKYEDLQIWASGHDGRPKEPLHCPGNGFIHVSGRSSRWEFHRPVWSDVTQDTDDCKSIFVSGGKCGNRRLDSSGINDGYISSINPWSSNAYPFSIYLFLSSFVPDPPFLDRSSTQIIRVQHIQEGELLVLGKLKSGNPRKIECGREYYLDPNKEFLLSKVMTYYPDGSPRSEHNFKYKKHPQLGYVPHSVTEIETNGGMFICSLTTTVTSFVLKENIDPKVFELEFPVGTRVNDNKTGSRYVVEAEEKSGSINPVNNGNSNPSAESK